MNDDKKQLFRLNITFIEGFYRFIKKHFFYKKDTIPIENGGTGKTTANDAMNALTNALNEGSETAELNDNVEFITQDTDVANKVFYRRKISVLWKYIKSKLSTVATSGAYKDLSGSPVNIEGKASILGKDYFIVYPEGGTCTKDGNVSGSIKILLPQKWTSTMIKFTVSIFNYVSNTSVDYIVSGYTYPESWYNNTAICIGKYGESLSNLSVNFGYVGNYAAIAIGDSGTVWCYPKVVVHDVLIGHSQCEFEKWNKGWQVIIDTTNITISQASGTSNPNVAYKSQIVKDIGNNADTSFAYSKAGLESATWLAAWNGYELRAISPSNINVGSANTASMVSGSYTGNGGQQSPSYVTSGKTRFNMWNAFKGITNPAGGYMDVILMDNYTGGDVPYVTGIGVTKNNGDPRMFVANGAKGGNGNWAHQVEVITSANIANQSVSNANTVGGKSTSDLQNYANLSNKPTSFPANGGTANYTNYINAIAIPANANFNSYTTPGFYYCAANSTVATLSNRPTGNAFFMIVGKHAGTYQQVVEYMTGNPKIYMRNYYNGTWGSWYRIYSTADAPPDTNTVYTHPTSSGNKHIPAGGSSGQILRWSADGTAVWGADNNTTYSNMRGASTSAAGAAGLVPAPAAGAATRYLRSDGTWQVPPDTNTTYSTATQSANGLMSAADKKKLDGIDAGANAGAASTHYHRVLVRSGTTQAIEVGDAGGSQLYSLRPATSAGDNKVNLGTTSYRFSHAYVAAGSVSTSDRYDKEEIQDLNKKIENFFMNLRPVSYKWKYDEDDKTHYGFIAQEIAQAGTSSLLTPDDMGMISADELDEPTEDGREIRWGLNYAEFHAIEVHMIQKLLKKVEELEDKFSNLSQ